MRFSFVNFGYEINPEDSPSLSYFFSIPLIVFFSRQVKNAFPPARLLGRFMIVSSLIVMANPHHKADATINSPSNFSRAGVHLVEEIS